VRSLRTGNARWITEIFTQFALAMGIGVACIYAVLVMLFHKFIQPVTILTALPPSAAGAIVALLICGYALAINSLIGLLMLMGIVTKNSILIVEYAIMAQRDQGLSRFDALIDSCSKRARPIVMTTIAMGAGMMPVAMGWAGDPSFRAPMGVAVVGGIIVSTVMSLFIVPATFTVFDDFQQWLDDSSGTPRMPTHPSVKVTRTLGASCRRRSPRPDARAASVYFRLKRRRR
jgi:multidrug efflux pump subunit AcrB